jgi:hypothetical protein
MFAKKQSIFEHLKSCRYEKITPEIVHNDALFKYVYNVVIIFVILLCGVNYYVDDENFHAIMLMTIMWIFMAIGIGVSTIYYCSITFCTMKRVYYYYSFNCNMIIIQTYVVVGNIYKMAIKIKKLIVIPVVIIGIYSDDVVMSDNMLNLGEYLLISIGADQITSYIQYFLGSMIDAKLIIHTTARPKLIIKYLSPSYKSEIYHNCFVIDLLKHHDFDFEIKINQMSPIYIYDSSRLYDYDYYNYSTNSFKRQFNVLTFLDLYTLCIGVSLIVTGVSISNIIDNNDDVMEHLLMTLDRVTKICFVTVMSNISIASIAYYIESKTEHTSIKYVLIILRNLILFTSIMFIKNIIKGSYVKYTLWLLGDIICIALFTNAPFHLLK